MAEPGRGRLPTLCRLAAETLWGVFGLSHFVGRPAHFFVDSSGYLSKLVEFPQDESVLGYLKHSNNSFQNTPISCDTCVFVVTWVHIHPPPMGI